MIWTDLIVPVVVLISVLLGYWMGRNSAGRHFSDTPGTLKAMVKKLKPSKPVIVDPYAEALRPNLPNRINTIEED